MNSPLFGRRTSSHIDTKLTQPPIGVEYSHTNSSWLINEPIKSYRRFLSWASRVARWLSCQWNCLKPHFICGVFYYTCVVEYRTRRSSMDRRAASRLNCHDGAIRQLTYSLWHAHSAQPPRNDPMRGGPKLRPKRSIRNRVIKVNSPLGKRRWPISSN